MTQLTNHTESLASVVVRLARPSDERAIERLAALDEKQTPRGSLLLAEIGGAVVAAKPLEHGEAVSDPFRHTAHVLELLELRARQIRPRRRRRKLRSIPRIAIA